MVGGISISRLLFVLDFVIETIVEELLRAVVLADYGTWAAEGTG